MSIISADDATNIAHNPVNKELLKSEYNWLRNALHLLSETVFWRIKHRDFFGICCPLLVSTTVPL